MSELNIIIDHFNERYNTYRSRLAQAKEVGDTAAAIILQASVSELEWCIVEVQAVQQKRFAIHEPYNLTTVFKFGKHKGKTVKEITETFPGYLDWCLENINGFQLEESVYTYWRERDNMIIQGS